MTHVAIAIVGFRNTADIVRCLDALGSATHADFEVVICENGGDAAFAQLTEAVPDALPGGQAIMLVQAPGNLGFAGGVNMCMANTLEADAWWVLNPDTQPAADALSVMVARLGAGDCQAVGCTLHLPDGHVQSYGGRWRSWLGRAESIGKGAGVDDPIDAEAIERVQNYLNGASMLVGRRFLHTVGPMREEYFLYCEEVEWCLRGLALGLRLGFAPTARVLHEQGTTTGAGGATRAQPRLPVYLGERNKMLLTRDCFPRRLGVAAIAALVLLALRYVRRGAWRQFAYGLEGWWDGLADKRGPPAWLAG